MPEAVTDKPPLVFNDEEKYQVKWKRTNAGFAIGYKADENGKSYLLVAKNDNIFQEWDPIWSPVGRFKTGDEWDKSEYAKQLKNTDEGKEIELAYFWEDNEPPQLE